MSSGFMSCLYTYNIWCRVQTSWSSSITALWLLCTLKSMLLWGFRHYLLHNAGPQRLPMEKVFDFRARQFARHSDQCFVHVYLNIGVMMLSATNFPSYTLLHCEVKQHPQVKHIHSTHNIQTLNVDTLSMTFQETVHAIVHTLSSCPYYF